jgi:5-methylthioadenosine/S-adenosylhomocysteine deaminase
MTSVVCAGRVDIGRMPMAALVIRRARVLRSDLRTCETADLLVEDGWIRAIEPPGRIGTERGEVIEATDRLLVPGLVNGHTHSHGGLGKGAVEDRVPLEVFLSASGAINGNRTIEDKWVSAALTAVELVRKGCTAAYDLFVEYPLPSKEGIEAVADAYAAVGMRAVIAPMMADRSLYEALPGLMEFLPPQMRSRIEHIRAAPYEASIEIARQILSGWRYDRDAIRPALGPTIPLHCSDAFLTACGRLASEFDVALQTHLAETKTQALLGHERYGKSLTAHLDELGLLGPRFSAAHGVWLDREDMVRLAGAGAGVVHNPMSNLRLGSGVAPARALLAAGIRLGIGTDATNTSDGQNMFEALRLAAMLSRIGDADYRQWLSAEEVFSAATEGSAAVLGFDRIGRLEPGYRADIVFLDISHINYVPLRRPLLQMVFAENGAAIDSVMIDGRFVLRHGRLLTIDEARLRQQAEQAVARLEEVNADAARAAEPFRDLVGHFCIAHARKPLHFHRRLPD